MSLKILTIDDSEVIRLIVSKAFKNFDCMVLEAENGLTGISVASREKPDLILLDYMMPVMDGFEVLAKLRSDPELKGIPVIMLTAEAARESVIKVAQLGVRDYLIKPFKGELLVERVSRVLDLPQRTASAKKRKRYDDPIGILVVDDKPAISAQVIAGLADTPWKVTRAEKPVEAIDQCRGDGVDVVLASLMLPNDGAFSLLQSLRSYSETAALPVFGMCVRTAAAEQTRAQQVGFAGVITKPIDCMELKTKVCRTLSLETSYKYFQQSEGYLIMTLPKDFNPAVSQVITANLETQLEGTAEAGGDRLVVDMSAVEAATVQVVELVLSAIELATKLPLRCAVVGTEGVQTQCLGFENTQSWKFATSVDQALELLK